MSSTATVPQETVESLATRIKEKYPDYANTDNHELVDKIVQKHPEYGERLQASERLNLPSQKQAFLAKQAQPTQFEAERKNESNTPWKDTLKGVGEGALQPVSTVSKLINKIPKVGETLAPSQGVGALDKLSTPVTPGEKLGAREANAASVLLPMTEGLSEAHAAGKLIPWAARGAGTLAKGVLGAAGGGYLGREVGGLVGQEKLGEQLGGLAGGLYGGYKGVKGEPLEIPSKLSLLKRAAEGGEEKPPASLPNVAPEPVVSPKPFELTPPSAERSAPIQDTMHFPKPMGEPETIGPLEKPSSSPMTRMGQLIEQGAGVKPLQPNVPLRNQRLPQVGNMPLGNRVGMDVGEQFGGKMQPAEGLPTMPQEEVGRQMGAPPLKENVPLAKQVIPKPGEPAVPSKQASLEEEFPDKAKRQMVHANGAEMVRAIGDDAETMKAVHDLSNPDVRQAMINSGEDMGQQMINNRKASGDISRQEAFARMLQKGLTPKKIVELARQAMAEK